MDTEKKPFMEELKAKNLVVEKYSGAVSMANVPAPIPVGKEAFMVYAIREGVVFHRDLPDAEGTIQGKPGEPAKHTKTDKEEYFCLHASGVRSFVYTAENE